MAAPDISHGRGGAGNINPDSTEYGDGEIVRVGEEGSHGDGAYSTGRGGAANIGDPGKKAERRADKDVVVPAATRPSADGGDYHTGRGGAGNEHVVPEHNHPKIINNDVGHAPLSLADKLKGKILGVFKK